MGSTRVWDWLEMDFIISTTRWWRSGRRANCNQIASTCRAQLDGRHRRCLCAVLIIRRQLVDCLFEVVSPFVLFFLCVKIKKLSGFFFITLWPVAARIDCGQSLYQNRQTGWLRPAGQLRPFALFNTLTLVHLLIPLTLWFTTPDLVRGQLSV